MTLDITIVLYDGMTTLDAVGPMEILRFLPGARTTFVAEHLAPIVTDAKTLSLMPTATFAEVSATDVVVVPGGPGTAAALSGPLVPWLADIHRTTRWTTSVCSGSLLLGAAGLLRGREATSHFAVLDHLRAFGADPVTQRVVVDEPGRLITAAGVSSGIDMALALAEMLTDATTADAVRLVVEYDPRPTRPGGSLDTASAQVIERAIELGVPHGAIPKGWAPS